VFLIFFVGHKLAVHPHSWTKPSHIVGYIFGDIPYISLYIIPQCIHHKTYVFSVSDIYVSSVFIVFILFVHWSNQHRPTNL
jgi:hypothetical protein